MKHLKYTITLFLLVVHLTQAKFIDKHDSFDLGIIQNEISLFDAAPNDLVTRAINAPVINTVVFNNVLVQGDEFIQGNLAVNGSTTYNSSVILGNLTVTGTATSGASNVIGDQTVGGSSTISGDLAVAGSATIVGDLVVSGTITAGGSNFVTGPFSSTVNAVARYADATGLVIKDSPVLVDDAGNIEIAGITNNGNTVAWPSSTGGAGTFLGSDGAGNLIYATPAGAGNVNAATPFTTDNRLIRTDLPSGSDNIQQSSVTLDDSNNITGVGALTATTVNATTFNGSLTGAASLNVLKTGDTMTGNLNMATQSEVRFQDSAGGEYVGLQAPAAVGTSYTISLPSTAPTAQQVLSANVSVPTTLEWASLEGSAAPAASETIYVSRNGNDTSGNGSFDFPYATLAKALSVANLISTSLTPVSIAMGPGIYIEDNSAGPLELNANGISIHNDSKISVVVIPTAPSNDLLLINKDTEIYDITFNAGGVSTASGITLGTGGATLTNVLVQGFDTGIDAGAGSILMDACIFISNGTGVEVNNIIAIADNCTFLGTNTLASPTGIGVNATGAGALVFFSAGIYTNCDTAFIIENNATLTLSGGVFRSNNTSFDVLSGASLILQATSFEFNPSSGTIVNIQSSGAGADVHVTSCVFHNHGLPTNNVTAIKVTNESTCDISGGEIQDYTNALVVGDPGDTQSTMLSASAVFIRNCTNDIIQQGSSTLNFQAGTAAGAKISINDSTNVQLAYFDPDDNNTLQIGSFADKDTKLIGASIGAIDNPQIEYKSNLYGAQALGYVNVTGNPATWYATSAETSRLAAITTDRSKDACLRLLSDTGSPLGGTTALRGWDICKNPSTAELAFKYSNSDTVGQSAITTYTLMQLDGVNNQVQLPTAATHIVFAADTNLYRDSANALKTDDNFIAAGTISAMTGFLGNVTGNLLGNVTGDVTGNLFGNATSATSAVTTTTFTGNLAGDVTGTQDATVVSAVGGQTAANVAAATVLANNATDVNTASQIVRRDGSGNFSASTITANLTGDVTGNVSGNAANFTGSLLGDVTGTQGSTMVSLVGGQAAASVASATVDVGSATSANLADTLVRRSSLGHVDFSTITGTLTGDVIGNVSGSAGSAASFSGSLLGDVTGTQAATVVSLVGGQTAADVASATVKVGNATNTNTANTLVERDASGNFSAGTITANVTGNVTGNLSGNATTATNATTAVNFNGSLSGNVTGNQSSTVVSSVGGQTAASVAAATVLANNATSSNTASQIVRRDGSGNFSAGTITANLTGNVTGDVTGNLSGNATAATSATAAASATNFTGSLLGDVTGTQGATVVSFVGGQTAANVAAATLLANTATSNNTANTIVRRDAFGNFNTNMISLNGTISNPTDATTKEYVDAAVSSGFTVLEPAQVVSTTNIILTGTQTIDGVDLAVNDRVLLVGQTDLVENGLWLVQVGAWTRPADFASGDQAGTASVLILSGTINAGTSWVCITPLAIIDTDPIDFAQFATSGSTTAANVGDQTGQIFRDKTGQTLNLKTLGAGDSHIVITNNTNDILIGTDAMSDNTVGTIVARDLSGTFTATSITASLFGAASLNVLKAGDTMTGNLNMAAQSEIRWQDLVGGEYVAFRAPSTVSASYTVDLPNTAPVLGQFLKASSATTTEWVTVDSPPSATKTYYVALNGNDSTNSGSVSEPFRTVSHAVSVANGVASLANPVVISVGAGIFNEDNSGGPITITASGISIVGSSITGTVLKPQDFANDFFSCTTVNVEFADLLITGSTDSTASAISVITNTPGSGGFREIGVRQFQTGFNISSAAGVPLLIFENIQFSGNATAISVNNIRAVIRNSVFLGPLSGSAPANTGISVTGSTALVSVLSSLYNLMQTAVSVTDGATARLVGGNIGLSTNGVVTSGASSTAIVGYNFINNNASSINLDASGANTVVSIAGSSFQCMTAGVPQGTAIKVSTAATIRADSCAIDGAVVGIACGTGGDTSTTMMTANGIDLSNCTTDVVQVGSSTLGFLSGVFAADKFTIADPTNVSIAAFDIDDLPAQLAIGNTTDNAQLIYEVLNSTGAVPSLVYEPNYYGYKGTVYKNTTNDPTFNGTQAGNNNASYYVITSDRAKIAGINLISNTDTIGNGDNVRGWSINKLATSASLAFTYTNNDISGQAARGPNAVMVLNGFDNQVEFPTATQAPLPTNTAAKLVWASDTNLYRSAANTLITDGDLIVGGLTANRVVTTNASKQLTSSAVTDTELGYLAGTTSSVQAQINGKVSKTGDAMTGALLMPVGSAAVPALQIGATNVGLSSDTGGLSFSTAGLERMEVSSTGAVSINGFTTAGVVHNDASGNLSSSLIVNADVDPAAAIVDTKLATISSTGKVANSATTATSTNTANAIVARDASGDFSAGTITASITGASSLNVLKAGDTMTGALLMPVGSVATPSLQIGASNVGLSSTAGGLSLSTAGSERIAISSGGAVSMSALTPAGVVHNDVSGNLSTSLIVNADVDPAAAIVDTKLATISTTGKVANSATTATSANTANAIVARDASGNFSAGTITASVIGASSLNVLKAGDTMTGALLMPVGSAATPSLQIGAANIGLSSTASGLSLSTNGAQRMAISSGGTVSINGLTPAGVVHNDVSGNLSSSLIVNADVSASAAIVDTKLATISTAGKVANSATTATSTNTASAIVARDGSGNFSAGTITASLTGAASLNVLKAGDTMTGTLTMPAGTTASPSIQFTGSTNTGITAQTANTLSFDTNGTERMNISTTAINTIAAFIMTNINANQAIQTFTATGNGQSVDALSDTSILLLTHTANRTNLTVTFPPNPINGQLFTIMLGTTNTISFAALNGGAGGATVVGALTGLNPGANFSATANGNSVSYFYYATNNSWYRCARG